MLEIAEYPVMNGGTKPSGYTNQYNENKNTITISQGGASAGYVNFITTNFWAGAHCYVIKPNEKIIKNRFLFFVLKSQEQKIQNSKRGAGIPALNKSDVDNLKIPIPPIPVQEEIVRILDAFTNLQTNLQTELELRKKQYKYYRDKLLCFEDIDGGGGLNVEYKRLGELINYKQPTEFIVKSTQYNDEYTIPVLTAGDSFILGYTNENEGIYEATKENPVIIFDDFTTSMHWVDFRFKVKSSAMKMLTPKEGVSFRYLYYAMKSIKYSPKEHARQWISNYSNIKIPLPPLEEQKRIVGILDKFDKLVNDISIGIPAEIEMRKKQYEYYRDSLLRFEGV